MLPGTDPGLPSALTQESFFDLELPEVTLCMHEPKSSLAVAAFAANLGEKMDLYLYFELLWPKGSMSSHEWFNDGRCSPPLRRCLRATANTRLQDAEPKCVWVLTHLRCDNVAVTSRWGWVGGRAGPVQLGEQDKGL